jgi:c-di-GMP-binding flagellar brake protein YcgR
MGSERFKVCCEVHYSGQNCDGRGIVRNLSLGGALIQADQEIKPHDRLTLELEIPDQPARLVISCAEVRWVLGYLMGVRFLTIEPETYRQLAAYLADRARGTTESRSHRERAA